jgi:hypothetical protein
MHVRKASTNVAVALRALAHIFIGGIRKLFHILCKHRHLDLRYRQVRPRRAANSFQVLQKVELTCLTDHWLGRYSPMQNVLSLHKPR